MTLLRPHSKFKAMFSASSLAQGGEVSVDINADGHDDIDNCRQTP